MSLDGDLDREQDIEELRRLAKAIQAQNQLLLQTLASKSREIDQLKGQTGDLQLTLKMLESLQAQASAVNTKLARAQATADSKRTKPKARGESGPTPQPNLPIVERLFELDAPDRVCPNCGKALRPIVGQYDESEMIDVVEVRYELVKVKQQKYACNCGRCIETALGPDRALTRSRYSRAFAIKVVLDKWLDHLPLERQCRILEPSTLVKNDPGVLARNDPPQLTMIVRYAWPDAAASTPMLY